MIKRIGVALVTFIMLLGMYIIPEKTRIITIASVLLLVFCYLSINQLRIINIKALVLWVLFIIIGGLSAYISDIPLVTTFEFFIAIFVGVIIGNVYIDSSARETILKGVLVITLIVFLGCVLQLVNPGLLSKITRITLGPDKYASFADFLS